MITRASMPAPPTADPRIADIARSGALRLALFPSFFYRRDAGGEPRGVGIEIAQALAERIGVVLRPTEYPSPPKVVEGLAAGLADVALLGIDPVRGKEVDFSPPLLAADFTYLVPENSAARAIADADRPGVRVALVRHHAMDTALRGKLTAAVPVYVDTPDAAYDLFREGLADVLAGIRPGLLMYAGKLPGTRVLDDAYGRNVIALAVKKGEAGRLAYVGEFAMQARADGTVTRAIASAGLRGVDLG
ncbi:MAG: transporter substrate-binding domain-containing protein [Xanthobacteraceae bacterium]|nr:transporter substrate-binding domain-containing protein [Xanthobacteraceae bacterium]